MMTMRRLSSVQLALSLALASSLVGLSGCTQVQVDPNTRGEYKFGELQVFADHNFATVHAAAVRGMKDANLFQTKDDRKVVEAELNGRDSTDTLVIVKIKEIGPNRTSLKIRYGVLKPDLPSAQRLHDAIKKYL